jgi:hypothetical protein
MEKIEERTKITCVGAAGCQLTSYTMGVGFAALGGI